MSLSRDDGVSTNRRHVVQSTAVLFSSMIVPSSVSAEEETSVSQGVTVYTTKSGLKYIDLTEGTGPTPKYGQLTTISYKSFIKLPKDSNPTQFDSDTAYLLKHGNGRNVPGLDEGLHSMKLGGTRRIIVPPKLGFVTSGLGPLPSSPFDRKKLSRLLDGMVEQRGGQVIFEVELKGVRDDEADQGYYTDKSLSVDDFNKLRENIQRAGIEARDSGIEREV